MPEPESPAVCPANTLGRHCHDIDPYNVADLGREPEERSETGFWRTHSGTWLLVTCIHCNWSGKAFLADREIAWEEPR